MTPFFSNYARRIMGIELVSLQIGTSKQALRRENVRSTGVA
jgi:hypothetical protein